MAVIDVGDGIIPPNSAVAGAIEFAPYEDVWEQDCRWVTGPGVLTDVILFLKGKALRAHADATKPGPVNVTLPLPPNTFLVIPEELYGLFTRRCQLVLDARREQVTERMSKFLGRLINPVTIAQMNTELVQLENFAIMSREAELWELAARAFGFHPYGLPQAAGMAI